MSNFRLQYIDASTANTTLMKDWQHLWERAENANIYNSYSWFEMFKKSHSNIKAYIACCYSEDRLVAILPCIFDIKYSVRVLTTPLNNYVNQETFLIESYDKSIFEFLFGKLLLSHNVHITKLTHNTARTLQLIFPNSFLPVISVKPYIDLQTNPEAEMSKSTKKNIRKILRDNSGRIHFEVYKSSDNLIDKFDQMVKIDLESGKQLKSRAIFSSNTEKHQFAQFITHCVNEIEICFLYFERLPIAYNFNFKSKNHYLAYQTSYLSEFKHLSPGKVMLFYLMEYAKNSQFSLLDLGEGASNYKKEFTQKLIFQYDLFLTKNSAIQNWWKLITSLRRIKQQKFPEKYSDDYKYLFSALGSV